MIKIRDLTISYGKGEPFGVSRADFALGQITALIGPNGSGKSTLLRAVAGIGSYSGSISVMGRECRSLNSRERARMISYLPQMLNRVNIDVETLAEHGRYPYHGALRKMSADDLRITDRALELTGMTGQRHQLLTELSGGEVQRAYLAMAFAQQTPMMLLDEPASHMDLAHQIRFFGILREIADAGTGVIIACHDIEQSFSYCDRICIMHDRNMAASGKPEELIRQSELLNDIFGASLVRNQGEGYLYKYGLAADQ